MRRGEYAGAGAGILGFDLEFEHEGIISDWRIGY